MQKPVKPKSKTYEATIRFTVPSDNEKPTVAELKDYLQVSMEFGESRHSDIRVGRVSIQEVIKPNSITGNCNGESSKT